MSTHPIRCEGARRAVTALGAAILGAFAVPAFAAGVVGSGSPGSCTEAALNAALVGGGNVTFNCGGSPVVIPITVQKRLSASTVIDGGSATLVTLDAGGASPRTRHFVTNDNVSLTVRNLTLRNGRCLLASQGNPPDPLEPAMGYGGSIRSGINAPLTITDSRFIDNACENTGVDFGGGAIRQRRGTLVIQRTLFQGNRAANAGAISSSDAVVTIEDSTFLSNTTNPQLGTTFSGVGGGFYNDESGNGFITIRRTVFQGNTAAYGAGALQSYFVPGDQGLVLEDCTFTGNSTTGTAGGGAALVQNNPPGPFVPVSIVRSTFTGNSAPAGGAIFSVRTPLSVTNSTFSGNTAGGAITVGQSSLNLSHVTIANNQGGAVVMDAPSGSIRGSIIANNSGAQCNAALPNAGFNVQFPATGTCVAGAVVADPQLGPLQNNGGPTQTRAIGGGSPALNLVTSGCPPPATDQRGVARPAGACDAGAYEANSTIGIANATVAEGNGGTTPATFAVSLSPAAAQAVTVQYATSNGTALAGSDYNASSGTVTFPPGSTSQNVNVPVIGDTLDEDDETFVVTLSNASGAAIGTAQAVGTIQDNDAAPGVSIGDCASPEGGVCGLAVTLSAPSGKGITVNYATSNGSATAGSDYQATSGTLGFAPGQTAAAVNVVVFGDTVDETDETFTVLLSAPVNVTIADGSGAGAIDDDDGPNVAAPDFAVTEGNAGTTPASFTLGLSAVSPQAVVVSYATSDGTAQGGSDFNATSGSVTFPPGSTSAAVVVNVVGDTQNEPDEVFYLNLTGATDGNVGKPATAARIRDDDGGVIRLGELGHGARLRDTFAGGADFYVAATPARSSWEVVLDEPSGDAGGAGGPSVQRLDADFSTVLQSAAAVGVGGARSLRWQNSSATAEAYYVRVQSAQCGTDCGADDTYRLRAYETTLRIPRFNNVGSQVSLVVLQNPTNASNAGTAFFWSSSGALLGSQAFTLNPRATLVLNTTTVPGVAGQGGSITVVHGGRYGELIGKCVALEPATGFSFDALAVPRLP
ncbi:MAG: Calx-beta domain-containing protein [Vicinamibacteria bacterium]